MCYDPVLKDNGVVVKYNNVFSVKKARKVDHVRWFEAMVEGENSNKFVVVFDDGTHYVFFRDNYFPENRYDHVIRIPSSTYQNASAIYHQINDRNFQPGPNSPDYKEMTREQIIKTMQKEVEDFDFNAYYSVPYK